MEAKNLRGRESENRRIWSREFNIDFFTRVGYADIRNRGATGKRLVPNRLKEVTVSLGGREVTSFGYLEKMVVFDLSSRFKSKSTLFLLVVFCSITGILY